MFGLGAIFGVFTGTKRLLILAAGSLVLGGFALNGGSVALKPEAGWSADTFQDSLRSNWSEDSPLKDRLKSEGNGWGDSAVRLGLSFIAAMIFGSLLRVALKTAITLAITGGAVLWLLQSQGVIEPMWDDYYGSVSESRNWLMNRVGTVGHFLKTHLPSASAALIGFGFGLRR